MRWLAHNDKEWHRWFAWYPVEVDGRWVWMEHVERCWDDEIGCSMDFSGYSFPDGGWTYRNVPEAA